jgi:hypothetical protein
MGVEYKMSKETYEGILKTRKSETEKRKNPKDYVIDYLNKTAGIKGEITNLIVG